MKYRITWMLCLLIVAWCGQSHAKPDILEKLRTTDRYTDVLRDLYLMGDDALPFLIQTLTAENQDVRQSVVSLLANYYPDPSALSDLTVTFLHDTDAQVRSSAAWAIASINTEYAKKLMVKHLNSDLETQEIIVDLLLRLKDERVIPKLVERLEDPKASPQTRRDAAYALADFKDKRAVPVLLDIIDDPKPRDLETVVKKLARIDDEQASLKLLSLLDSAIGHDVAEALQLRPSILPPLLEMLEPIEAFETLVEPIEAADHRRLQIWQRILHVLGKARDPKLAPIYGKLYLETDDSELHLRSVIVSALQNMGAEGFGHLLYIAQQIPDSRVLDALASYNSAAAVDAVAAFALDRSSPLRVNAVDALTRFGGLWKAEVFKHIPQLLADPNSKVKLLTLDFIRRMGLTEATPALKQLTQDADENIRNAAHIVLDVLSWKAQLTLKVETDLPQYDYGQPITLTYRLTNVSNHPIKIAIMPNIRLKERLDIQQPDGTTARYKGLHADFFGSRLEDYKTLHPDDELTGTISISQVTHQIHQSGKHTVNLRLIPRDWYNTTKYDFMAWPYTVTSKVDFNIAPPTTYRLNTMIASINPERIAETSPVEVATICGQLGELGQVEAVPALKTLASWIHVEGFSYPPDFVLLHTTARDAALSALSKFADPELIPMWIKMLERFERDDRDLTARDAALSALSKFADPELIPMWIKMLERDGRDPTIEFYAIEALGNSKDPRAIEPLRTCAFRSYYYYSLKDASDIRSWRISDSALFRVYDSLNAARALQQLGDDSGVIWHKNVAHRRMQHWKKEERIKAAGVLRTLHPSLKPPSVSVQIAWNRPNALTGHGFYDRNDSPTLASDWAVIIKKAGTLPGLKTLLEHPIPAVRRAAAYELAYLGDASGVSMIQTDLYANEVDTRRHARETLLKLQRQ